MGTYYKVSINSSSKEDYNPDIVKILDEINQEMSTYIDDSLISKFNLHPVNSWFPVSLSFMEVFKKSIEVCKLSEGYFDITVGKIVEAWGFGSSDITSYPSSIDMERALEEVSCESVIQKKDSLYLKKISEVLIDFSAIAKGYAVDQISKKLKEYDSVKGFMVDVGGEITVYGYKHNKIHWAVGISHPYKLDVPIYKINTEILKDFSMATSGDYRNFKEVNGDLITHTIDTRTGKPMPLLVTSVSVFGGTAMKADALATALNAMGNVKALKFANKNNISAIFVIKKEDKFILEFSNNFKKQVQ